MSKRKKEKGRKGPIPVPWMPEDLGYVEKPKLNVGDHREFPSLSGAPQAQQNTTAQQMWANPTLRAPQQNQQNTIGRPQGQGQQQPGQAAQAANQQQQSQGQDDSSQSQFSEANDNYRFGGQGGVGQLGGVQPQTGNIEEFPPLGGAGGDIAPDRRAGLIQNAAAFGATGNNAFPGLGQTRNGLPSPTDSQQDRSINPTVGGRGLQGAEAVSRTPFDSIRAGNPQEVCSLGNVAAHRLMMTRELSGQDS
jgi:CCR4-NOT transcription complex subunit 2